MREICAKVSKFQQSHAQKKRKRQSDTAFFAKSAESAKRAKTIFSFQPYSFPLIRVGHNYYFFYIYFRSCDQELNPNHYRIIPVPFPFHYRGYPRLYLIHYRTLVGLFAHKICSCKSGKNGKVPHFILIRLVPFLTKLVPF